MDERSTRKRRLFTGIALGATARAACANVSAALRETGFSAKYENAEKLHVTLAFLGFVDSSRLDALSATLAACAKRSRRFSVTLDKLGAFPHERRPRVVYLGARDQGARYRELAADIRGAYGELGFVFDNDPVAHVTIARVKESKRPLPLIEFGSIPLEITTLSLFESLPDPAKKTSRYEIVASASLGAE